MFSTLRNTSWGPLGFFVRTELNSQTKSWSKLISVHGLTSIQINFCSCINFSAAVNLRFWESEGVRRQLARRTLAVFYPPRLQWRRGRSSDGVRKASKIRDSPSVPLVVRWVSEASFQERGKSAQASLVGRNRNHSRSLCFRRFSIQGAGQATVLYLEGRSRRHSRGRGSHRYHQRRHHRSGRLASFRNDFPSLCGFQLPRKKRAVGGAD